MEKDSREYSGYHKRYEELLSTIQFELQPEMRQKFDLAFESAFTGRRDKTSLSGQPCIAKTLDVFEILTTINADATALLSALLLYNVDNNCLDPAVIRTEYGSITATVLQGLLTLKRIHDKPPLDKEKQIDFYRMLVMSIVPDLRVLFVQFAIILQDLRNAENIEESQRIVIAKLAREIYAPIAHRFGIRIIKWQLEDLSLKITNPDIYYHYARSVSTKLKTREKDIDILIAPIRKELEKEGIDAQISGRAKHLYSIYNKVIKRGKEYEDILDLSGVRIIVNTIEECYHTLSLVHSIYEPLLSVYGDYIAKPKPNGYQSLHTKVIDYEGTVIEVQIRTREMDLVAEMGIAAHWTYKKSGSRTKSDSAVRQGNYQWIREVIKSDDKSSADDQTDHLLKIGLYEDLIFVYTPEFQLVKLRRGSTPLDFAFHVHTDVGLSAIGAKVNDRIVPFDHELSNCDVVSIKTGNNARPNRDWLAFVRTPKARAKIKWYLKKLDFDQSVNMGRELFKAEFGRRRLKLSQQDLVNLSEEIGSFTVEEFYAAIGTGESSAQNAFRVWTNMQQALQASRDDYFPYRDLEAPPSGSTGVLVDGSDAFETTFGACCHPVPGDDILCYISTGRGFIIHRQDCPNVRNLKRDKSRIVTASWNVGRDAHFRTRVRVETVEQPNLMRDLIDVFAMEKAKAFDLKLKFKDSIGSGIFLLEVDNLEHLNHLITKMLQIKGVVSVERLGGVKPGQS